jgi:hypothetical protein
MGTMLTYEQMCARASFYNLHPEVQRRFKALIEFAASQGVPLGIGTGWRVQPNPPPPGFAKPGNSWHESCPVAPSTPTALAIDTVPDVSWQWMQDNCAAYGFRTFRNIGNEPWHIQPAEIPTSRSYATKLPPLLHWNLPGEHPKPPPKKEEQMATAILHVPGWNAQFIGQGPLLADGTVHNLFITWFGPGPESPFLSDHAAAPDVVHQDVTLETMARDLILLGNPEEIQDATGEWTASDFFRVIRS